MVRSKGNNEQAKVIAERIRDGAYDRGSRDNITAMVIDVRDLPKSEDKI